MNRTISIRIDDPGRKDRPLRYYIDAMIEFGDTDARSELKSLGFIWHSGSSDRCWRMATERPAGYQTDKESARKIADLLINRGYRIDFPKGSTRLADVEFLGYDPSEMVYSRDGSEYKPKHWEINDSVNNVVIENWRSGRE